VLQAALEREAWDGSWYRRGYFDDGTPLGSVASSECRIDAIAQSWAVISGAADPARVVRAMDAMDEQLIRRHDGLALLFTPPFDRTPLDPGYIKGYPPGLRENGGQYTHAATWSVIAWALQGQGDRAGALFAMLNPINHALSAADAYRYKVEPYVIAADVYAAAGHVGRGGWTWYTGSAGWMYRAGLEFVLGLRREGSFVRIEPCIPRSWPGYELRLRHGTAQYVVAVENPAGVESGIRQAWVDGGAVATGPVRIALVDDGAEHLIRVVLG
jgi:cyclic beta-1,2-glucan synthetase